MDNFTISLTQQPYTHYLQTNINLTDYYVSCLDVRLPNNFPTVADTTVSSSAKFITVPGGCFKTLIEYLDHVSTIMTENGMHLSMVLNNLQTEMIVTSSEEFKLPLILSKILNTETIEKGNSKLTGPFNFAPKMMFCGCFCQTMKYNSESLPILALVDLISGQAINIGLNKKCISTPSMIQIVPVFVDPVQPSNLLGHGDFTIVLSFTKA